MTDEEKKEALASAINLYKYGKAKKNEPVFTLRSITDEEFIKLGKMDMKDSISHSDSKEIWYNQRYKQLREMFKAFDVWDEFNSLKRRGKSYSFSNRNKAFILMLLREYNGKFERLKRGDVSRSDGAYLLTVYNGILDIFYDADAPEEIIESVMLKLWDRLNIPQRNMDATIDSVCEECKRMVKKNIEAISYGMGIREKLLWQAAFRQSFYRFLLYWDTIYSNMENIRQEEIRYPDLEAIYIYPEIKELTALEIKYGSEIQKAYDDDPEIQELLAERKNMLGYGKKKPPLVRDIETTFRENSAKLEHRMAEIQLKVIRKYEPHYQYPDKLYITPPVHYSFKPPHQLLEEAMDEEQNMRKIFPITSLVELLNRIQGYYP